MRASVGKKRPSKACSKCEFDRAGLGSPIVSVGVPHHAPLPLLAKFESHPQFSRQSTSLSKAEPILYLGRKTVSSSLFKSSLDTARMLGHSFFFPSSLLTLLSYLFWFASPSRRSSFPSTLSTAAPSCLQLPVPLYSSLFPTSPKAILPSSRYSPTNSISIVHFSLRNNLLFTDSP